MGTMGNLDVLEAADTVSGFSSSVAFLSGDSQGQKIEQFMNKNYCFLS